MSSYPFIFPDVILLTILKVGHDELFNRSEGNHLTFGFRFSKFWLLGAIALLLVFSACGRTSIGITDNSPTKDSVASKNGLVLSLEVGSTDYHPGDTISITLDEINTLAKNNLIPAADLWTDKNLILGFSTNVTLSIYPFGLSILQGDYNESDYAAVVPLESFYDMNAIYLGGPPEQMISYDFEPSSDVAVPKVYQSGDFSPISMIHTNTVTGFWVGTWGHAIYSDFTPGTYTIVGGDEWGAIAILHFTVVSP